MAPEMFDSFEEPTPFSKKWERVPDDGLGWKEQRGQSVAVAIFQFSVMVLVVWMSLLHLLALLSTPRAERGATPNDTLAYFGFIMLCCISLAIFQTTIRLTGCIVGERERQTLDALLTLPMSSTELLWAKIVGNAKRQWIWLLPFGFCWLVLLLSSGWNPLGGLLMLIALAVHLTFFAMLALFLSVFCRTSVAAYVSLAVILMLLLIGTVIAGMMLPMPSNYERFLRGMNPILCWMTVSRVWSGDGSFDDAMGVAGYLTLYVKTAVMLWLLSWWKFSRQA